MLEWGNAQSEPRCPSLAQLVSALCWTSTWLLIGGGEKEGMCVLLSQRNMKKKPFLSKGDTVCVKFDDGHTMMVVLLNK